MYLAADRAFVDRRLFELKGDLGTGYFDSCEFEGITLSRIRCAVSKPLEIEKTSEKTWLNLHICLLGGIEYLSQREHKSFGYGIAASEIKIVSGELQELKAKLPVNNIAEISISFNEQACKKIIQAVAFPGVNNSIAENRFFSGSVSLSWAEELNKVLWDLIELPHPKNMLEHMELKGYVYAALGKILSRTSECGPTSFDKKLRSAEQVKQLIDSNVKNNQTIRQLASVAGTNECYLKKEFKALTGSSILAYRQKKRMQRAQVLLSQGFQDIDFLAAEVGYRNADHFTRIFRRHIGFHPRECSQIGSFKSQ